MPPQPAPFPRFFFVFVRGTLEQSAQYIIETEQSKQRNVHFVCKQLIQDYKKTKTPRFYSYTKQPKLQARREKKKHGSDGVEHDPNKSKKKRRKGIQECTNLLFKNRDEIQQHNS